MSVYNNPRYAQLYTKLTDTSKGLVPLPACKNAYALGPSAADTALSIRWLSNGYNFGASTDKSKCGLIKDESDVFYYAIAYESGATFVLTVNVYDAPNDTNNVYTITNPAELSTIFAGGLNDWHWLVRKKSSTEMDFVVYGDDGAGNLYLQHYTWTIGTTTFTYAGGYNYATASYTSLARMILGDLVIEVYRDSSDSVYYKTYDLDTQTTTTTQFFDRTGHPDQTYDYAVYYAGAVVYLIVFYPTTLETKVCFFSPGIPFEVAISVRGDYSGTCFHLDGSITSFTSSFDNRTGHAAYILPNKLSDAFGASPDTGTVYARLKWSWGQSDDNDCGLVPEEAGEEGQFIRITTSGVELLGDGSGLTDSSTWPSELGGAANIEFGNAYAFHGRSDPIFYDRQDNPAPTADDYFLLHWATKSGTAENALPAPTVIPSPVGTGQRNDNLPELFAVRSGSNNVWYDDSGNVYLTQTTPSYGDTLLPVTGMYGIWPVHHRDGRWAIFNSNTQETVEGHWYVV